MSVAKFRNALEPEGLCNGVESRELLQRLCPLLEALGKKTKHPNLLKENAIDSIGRILNESDPETHRIALVQAQPHLKVYLRRRTHEVLFVEASEKLPDVQRLDCVAIRGTAEVARRLGPSERGKAELLVEFGDAASILVKEQTLSGSMLVLCTSVAKKRKVLSAMLGEECGVALEKLFDGAGRGSRAAVPFEPLHATLVKYKDTEYSKLPFWYAEMMAIVCQDVFRLHVLASASSPASAPVSRMLFVDSVNAHRMDGPGIDRDDAKTIVKVIWHKASGGCLCDLHNKSPTAPFRRIEMRMEVCGMPLVNGSCERHCAEGATCVQSSAFPGICAKAFKVELRCMHEFVKGQAPCGVRIPLSGFFHERNGEESAFKEPLLDLACCGVVLTHSPSAAALKDLKEDAMQVLGQIKRLRKETSRSADDLENRDCAAVWLLRKGGVSLNPDGKLKGVTNAEFQKLASSHGQLFRKTQVK